MTRRTWLGSALLVALLAVLVMTRTESARYDLPDGLDTIEAVELLAAHHEHGWDDQFPPDELDAVAAERRIVATCGYVSAWAVSVLEREGFEARMVHTLTLDKWDDRNNGHTMIEAKVDGAWVLFDIDRDIWYWHDGRPLSLPELVRAVPIDGYTIRPLSSDLGDVDEIRRENRRLIQVPMVSDGEAIWFTSSRPHRVAAYSSNYRAMERRVWLARFYG